MEYWYRFREDLWKRVHVDDGLSSDLQLPYERPPIVSDEKSFENVRRAQRVIEAYALCNDWQWFVTLTLNPKKRARDDLDAFRRSLVQFVRDERKRTGSDISFLFVPELHPKKGSGWHMHGLVNHLPMSELRPFTLSERLPVYLRDKLSKGEPIFDWPRYRERFGWVDVEPIRNRDAAARYITKYCAKGMHSTASHIDVCKHLYFVSRGLRRPELVYKCEGNSFGTAPSEFPYTEMIRTRSYQYDYGTVYWYEYAPSAR